MTLRLQTPQAGISDITTDASGDGSVTITLKNPISETYAIVATIREPDATGTLYVTTITSSSFKIYVDGSAVISGTLTVSWMVQRISQE